MPEIAILQAPERVSRNEWKEPGSMRQPRRCLRSQIACCVGLIAAICLPAAEPAHAQDATRTGPSEDVSTTGAAAGTGALSTAGTSEENPQRPNILLVTMCSVRYDHLTPSGYQRNTTPFLDRLARRGAFFEYAIGASSWTKPAVASIITGLSPNAHQQTDFYSRAGIQTSFNKPPNALSNQVVTLAECLKGAGYATFSRINNVHAGDFFNMTQGVDDCVTRFRMTTRNMVADFSKWLDRNDSQKPFFCHIMTRDAHIPYRPQYKFYKRFSGTKAYKDTKGYLDRANRVATIVRNCCRQNREVPKDIQRDWINLYDGEIAQLDQQLHKLVDLVRKKRGLNSTIIAITSDHGDRLFGPHGACSHSGGFMENALVHVPLILTGPGIKAEQRFEQVVRTIDLYPTLAALAAATPPEYLQGRSLVPLLSGQVPTLPPAEAFASFDAVDHLIVTQDYKLHLRRTGAVELYKPATDPQELNNLFIENAAMADSLLDQLGRWLQQEGRLRNHLQAGQTEAIPPDIINELRNLGYVD